LISDSIERWLLLIIYLFNWFWVVQGALNDLYYQIRILTQCKSVICTINTLKLTDKVVHAEKHLLKGIK